MSSHTGLLANRQKPIQMSLTMQKPAVFTAVGIQNTAVSNWICQITI